MLRTVCMSKDRQVYHDYKTGPLIQSQSIYEAKFSSTPPAFAGQFVVCP